MKKRLILAVAAVMLSVSLTGCVKVIDKGTEGEYTGEVAFDASANSSDDWTAITEEVTGNAKELGEVLSGDGIGTAAAVSGSGEITEFITKGPKNILAIKLDGYDGPETFMVQIGSVYSGTAIRDIQSVKSFESFTNQTEWSQYAKALNKESAANVCEPLGLDASCEGKTANFVGAAMKSSTTNDIIITPVSLSIE